ncbi:hypothetical protein AB9K21_01770 [Anaplasma phagocytophilum]|uniref:Uncharacterized protein n=2 Tax=Anaplasma phagocytophilum TaxID=948 RepID=A0A0F3NJ41_ANAPH|nr:hypothetical protein [Anaplasma phagocytophilum]KJV64213.1 hypothetical protein APHMUC_0551 [Anaplasma phagocytophilum str. ApMUC09]KJV67732.1 hypothetical protein APHNP_0335 [Anaplasma phagocytophilum str. ApNP]
MHDKDKGLRFQNLMSATEALYTLAFVLLVAIPAQLFLQCFFCVCDEVPT